MFNRPWHSFAKTLVYEVEKTRRLAYLEALGIESWVFQQPGLQSKGTISNGTTTVDNIEPTVASLVAVNESQNHRLRSFWSADPKSSPEVTASADTNSPPSPEEQSSGEGASVAAETENKSSTSVDAHFAFVSFYTTQGTLVLAELGDSDAPGLSASESALLEAILFALQQKPAIDQPLDAELFAWPALVGAHQDRGVEAATQAVKALINGKINRHNLQRLLLLGAGVTQQAKAFLADKVDINVVATLSLSDMLFNPALKARVWRDIQGFVNS